MNQPEWWQLMLQYGAAPALVAVVSTVALIVQNSQNNAREERRRRDDALEREKDRAELAKDRDQRANEAMADRAHQHEQADQERSHQRDLASIARKGRADEARQRSIDERAAADSRRRGELHERWRDERRGVHTELLGLLEQGISAIKDGAKLLTTDERGMVVKLKDSLHALPSPLRTEIGRAVAAVQIIGSQTSRAAALECQEALLTANAELWWTTFRDTPENGIDDYRRKFNTATKAVEAYVDAIRADLGTAD